MRGVSPTRILGLLALIGAGIAIGCGEVELASSYFDVLAPFRTHFFVIAVGGGIAVWLGRHGFLILCCSALISAGLHSSLALSRQVKEIRTLDTLPNSRRVVFANAWEHNKDQSTFIAFLRTVPAEIVVLAEFGEEEWPGMMQQLLPSYPYQQTCVGQMTCKVAILSRIPFAASGFHRKTWLHPAIVWARFEKGVMGDRPLTLVGTHIWRPTRNPHTHRFHLDTVAEILRRTEGALVVTADFNAPVWSRAMRRLMETADIGPPDCMLPSWPAWPLTMPQFTFDNILVSPGVSVARMGLGPAVGSDHLPIWADIVMRPGITTRCGR